MHRKPLLILAALLLLAGCRGGPLGRELASQARDIKLGGGQHKDEKAPIVFDAAPFDLGRASLPPRYNGNDITEVYDSFDSGGQTLQKGKKRPPRPPADRDKGATTAVYAFRESIAPGPPGNDFEYDADHCAFKIRIRVESPSTRRETS